MEEEKEKIIFQAWVRRFDGPFDVCVGFRIGKIKICFDFEWADKERENKEPEVRATFV